MPQVDIFQRYRNPMRYLGRMWLARQVLDLFDFMLSAKTPSDLHSPYLFDLFREVMADHKHYYAFRDIENLRNALKKLNPEVPVIEYGAGSRALSGSKNSRPLRQIINSAVSPPRKCRLLFRLVKHLQPSTLVELGISAGISTAYMAAACRTSDIIGFDGNAHLVEWAQTVMSRLDLKNVQFRTGPFDDTLPEVLDSLETVDFAYLDGNHKLNPTLEYIQLLLPKLSGKGVIMLDDIRWSREMFDAWTRLNDIPDFTACVDCYSYGLLFVNPDIRERLQFRLIPSRFRPLGY